MKNHRAVNSYITLIFFMMFLYGINGQMIGTVITRIILHYNIQMAKAGLLSSCINAGNFAAIFVITIFSGRINKMILLGASLLFISASQFLISTAPAYGFLLASFALVGLFGATLDNLVNSLTADLRSDSVSRYMSFLHGFYGLGGLCGPIIVDRLAANFSWSEAYNIISAVFLFYLVIYALFVRLQWTALTAIVSNEKQSRFGPSDMIQFFMKKRHLLLWVVMFFYGGNQSTLAVWIKRYVETHLNEPSWGAYALSAMWFGTAISRLFLAPNIKASSLQKIFVGNFISGIALAAGLWSGSVVGILAASLAVGLSSGLSIPLILATGCEWHPDRTAFGTLMPFTALFISYVLFPPFSGLLSDIMGIPWGVALGALSAIFTAVFARILDGSLKRSAGV